MISISVHHAKTLHSLISFNQKKEGKKGRKRVTEEDRGRGGERVEIKREEQGKEKAFLVAFNQTREKRGQKDKEGGRENKRKRRKNGRDKRKGEGRGGTMIQEVSKGQRG